MISQSTMVKQSQETILWELATNPPFAAWMNQLSQVASLFAIFTHPAKTFDDKETLRNSSLKVDIINDECQKEG
ncbi:hypothetical protein PVA17_21110 [Lysinibacillus sp. CNPSo 3705]|uniref:hypothetical protein n=1 Tax=Lysinibacillus sp. CNPSo 3705 TaxID=3028148 RepID=UPI002363B915|nr:hypothetical protein [Lysinibacillus sp. CNPSo 3705]MDD1505224.1 hypothetical protein [Lysinibacillus sp. CNPSo 3705]